MDIDFSLVLLILVVISGCVALYDRLVLAGPRKASADRLRKAQTVESDAIRQAIVAAEQEPVVVEYAKSFFPVLLIVLVLRSFLVEPFQIPSGSMIPTLEVGDFILVNKFAYGIRLPVLDTKIIQIGDPQRGDVMVFRYPSDPQVNYIKRVIGLPGDRIQMRNNQLFINDKAVPKEFVGKVSEHTEYGFDRNVDRYIETNPEGRKYTTDDWGPDGDMDNTETFVVPEGNYFFMGDNRDNSLDSRYWGFVADSLVRGSPILVYYSYSPDSSEAFDWLRRVRWRRMTTVGCGCFRSGRHLLGHLGNSTHELNRGWPVPLHARPAPRQQ